MFLLLRHHKTNSSSPHPCVHASNSQSPGIIKRRPTKRIEQIFFILVSWVLRGRTRGQEFFLGVPQSKTGNYLSATSFWENGSFCCRLLTHYSLHTSRKYRYRQNKHRNGGERRSIKQVGGGATPHQLKISKLFFFLQLR